MRDQDQIIELLFKFGGIPPEVTNWFILPHLDLLPCGCTYQNKDRECPKFKIKKRQPHICIRCKKQTVFKNSHYCIFCKCNVMDSYCSDTGEIIKGCPASCIGYLMASLLCSLVM